MVHPDSGCLFLGERHEAQSRENGPGFTSPMLPWDPGKGMCPLPHYAYMNNMYNLSVIIVQGIQTQVNAPSLGRMGRFPPPLWRGFPDHWGSRKMWDWVGKNLIDLHDVLPWCYLSDKVKCCRPLERVMLWKITMHPCLGPAKVLYGGVENNQETLPQWQWVENYQGPFLSDNVWKTTNW